MGIVTTIVAPVAAAGDVESVYRQDGDRLWRALYAFAGRRGCRLRRGGRGLRPGAAPRLGDQGRAQLGVASAFRLATGDLKRQSSLARGPMPEGAFHDAHADEQLLAALQELTPQQRAVIVLHYYADCPVREISRRTGINPLAVRAHLSRGRKHLRVHCWVTSDD